MKKLLFALGCLFLAGSTVFAADGTIAYSCGFEDSEDTSQWNLVNADVYNEADETTLYNDLYTIGAATAKNGTKALYLSGDNGNTNDITLPMTSGKNQLMANADLSITLTPGNYIITFDYKYPSQSLAVNVMKDRLDYDTFLAEKTDLTKGDDWQAASFAFTLTETGYWVNFYYGANVTNETKGTQIAGIAIDNVVIERLSDFVIDEDGVLTDYVGEGGDIVLPVEVKSIDEDAFATFGHLLTSITIPASVENIDGYPFYTCESLQAINVDNGNANYSSADGVLYNKDQSTLLIYPMGKTDTEFVIPNTVTTIQNAGVSACPALQSLTIPASVTNIQSTAFNECINLSDIYLAWATADVLAGVSFGSKLFDSSIYPNCIIHIPAGMTEAYAAIKPWSLFDKDNIVENTDADDDPITSVSNISASEIKIFTNGCTIFVANASDTVFIYNTTGSCVAQGTATAFTMPKAGIYIVRTGNTAQKVVVIK